MEKYFLSMLVDNEEGVLSRILSLFTRKGYRINSLSLKETENSEYSRMAINFSSNNQLPSQIASQISKLIDVRKIEELTEV